MLRKRKKFFQKRNKESKSSWNNFVWLNKNTIKNCKKIFEIKIKKWSEWIEISKKMKFIRNEHKGRRVQLCRQSCESGCATWLPLKPSRVQETLKAIPLMYRHLCVRYRMSTFIYHFRTAFVPKFIKIVPLWYLS